MLPSEAEAASQGKRLGRLGALASFLLVVAFVIAPAIYLTGNLRAPGGAFTYSLADFLYGPVWGASLITVFAALRERIGETASRRSSLALLASVLAAGAMVLVACIRAANRHYHLVHPDLHLEKLRAGPRRVDHNRGRCDRRRMALPGLGPHFARLGCLDIAPPAASLAVVYLIGGVAALFVYVRPELEGMAGASGVIWSIWQGICLLRDAASTTPSAG